MGFNSVLMICNDAISAIEKDPEGWWRSAWEALARPGSHPVSFSFGSFCGYFHAVSNDHADTTKIIAAGGNYATVLASVHDRGLAHHTEEGQLRIVKLLAEKLGYRLVKKRKKIKRFPDEEFEEQEIRLDIGKQFTPHLGPRHKRYGPHSGELYLEEWLLPAWEKARPIIVSLDSIESPSPFFLEEVFGGIVRRFGLAAVEKRLRFDAVKNKHLERSIRFYMQEAEKER